MSRARPLPPDERRRTIIEATRPLLIEHGAGFTTAQVARAAGIAEGTIFRVFASKQELLDVVIADALDPAHTLQALADLPPEQTLTARVTAIVGILTGQITTTSALFTALHAIKPTRHCPHGRNDEERRAHTAVLLAAITEHLAPYADQLRISPARAASWIGTAAVSSSHPLLTDQQFTDPVVIAGLLLDGLRETATTIPPETTISPETNIPPVTNIQD